MRVLSDHPEATAELLAAVGRSGARDAELSWSLPGVPEEEQPDDVPAGVPCVWTVRATWARPHPLIPGAVVERVVVVHADPSVDHGRAQLEACVLLLRQLGATVTRTGRYLRVVGTLRAPE